MIKYDTHTPKGAHLETSGAADEILVEILTLISALHGELARVDTSVAAAFREGVLKGLLLPHSPVWRDPPKSEGVSMVIPMPDKEKGMSNAE